MSFKFPLATTSWDKEEIDAVAIAVVPDLQYEIAVYAIKKGIHVFAEKPLTANYIKAKHLLSLARKKNIIHSVDFIFTENNLFKKVKKMIEKNKYGKLKDIRVFWDFESYDIKNNIFSWKTDVDQGGGALSFYFSHILYYLEYFAGKILNFKSTLSYSLINKKQIETGVDMLLKFEKGINGVAHINCNLKGYVNHQLIFQFEKGTIVLENRKNIMDNFSLTVYSKNEIKTYRHSNIEKKENDDERVKYVGSLAQRFIESCMKNIKTSPNFEDGVRVEELVEKIRRDQV